MKEAYEMRWTVTKRYFRGNVGASNMDTDYNFWIGKKIGPKSLWDKLCEVEEGWDFYKGDGEYVFENHHIDSDGNSWGRSEVVLTYLNYYTIYDYLDKWLKKGKIFEVWWDDDGFSEWVDEQKVKEEDDEEDEVNYVEDVKAEEVRKIVEDYILYNFPEETIEIVTQGVPAGMDGELFCNNPYASPEYSLDWEYDDKEFRITIQSPSDVGNGYIPFEGELVITITE